MSDTAEIKPGDKIGENIALGKTERIPTMGKHYKQFSHKHALEWSKEFRNDEWETKIGSREMFGLYAPTVFGEQRVCIDVTGIKYLLANRKMPFEMYQAQLNATWIDYSYKAGGCEETGIERLQPRDLRRPGIMVMWGRGNQSMIDGNHRLVRRWREGLTTFDYAMVIAPDVFAAKCIVPEGDEYKFLANPSN